MPGAPGRQLTGTRLPRSTYFPRSVGRMAHATIEGRNVYHRVGGKTQTVNICTSDNREGVYEARYWLDVSVEISAAELAASPDLFALRAWLVGHGGQPLLVDSRPGDRMPSLLKAPAAGDLWVAEAKAAVERVLNVVVDSFLQRPYLHRVEHSLHAELWSLLKQEGVLQDEVTLSDGKTSTQLVHKEWPETAPRTKLDGTRRPRGLFDLAVLSPQQVRKATLEQLIFGRIEAPIVIEVGLDYGLPHLEQDASKLIGSAVPAPYLLHLSRLTDKNRCAAEKLLCSPPAPIRTAYVHLDPRTAERRWKHVYDAKVSVS